MRSFIDSYFKISERGSDIRTELVAGVTTFLTMMYIVPLNGIIMSHAGMPIEAVITATALVTMVATVTNGLWSNTPIAMSVGLGLNSYFVFSLVIADKIPWQTVLGIVFLSGVLFLVLTLTRLRRLIIESISPEFKITISAGIGFFIAFIGLKEMGIVAAHRETFVTLGNLADRNVQLGAAGLFILIFLVMRKVRGAFILGILLTSVIGYLSGLSAVPDSFFSFPASISPIAFRLDIGSAFKISLLAPIFTFMLTDLFDSLGTLAGVGHRAGLFSNDDSSPIQRTLEVDAGATVLGSIMGLSTTTSFIESAAGVEEGGRTGLAAVVTGFMFALTLFLLPFFKTIPHNAIYPVLVMVGIFMFADLRAIDFSNLEVGIPAFLIILVMPLTFSITLGLGAGFISHTFILLVSGKWRKINIVTAILSLVSILAFVVQ